VRKMPIKSEMIRKPRPTQEQYDLLSQQEADRLLAMEKERAEDVVYPFPIGGKQIVIPLVSCDKTHNFLFDINSSRLQISKHTFQTRTHGVIPLIRLDINSRPHINPDQTDAGRTHLHRYRSGSGLDWAVALPETFGNPNDIFGLLHRFMDECRIIGKPKIELLSVPRTLFDHVND